MTLIDDLTGGFLKPGFGKNKEESQTSTLPSTYNIYIQFDKDEPVILYTLDKTDVFEIVLDGTVNNLNCLTFVDTNTGKEFKLFSK